MLEQWQLEQYRMAARTVCERMQEHPDEPMLHRNGVSAPRWVICALQMHELRLMQQAMADYGPYGPP